MKPYQQVPIVECNEPLVEISPIFPRQHPHAYQGLGATYGEISPYHVRQGVLDRLILAQECLQRSHPDWQILIFDAYRPIAVQQFMVDYTFAEAVKAQGLTANELTSTQQQKIQQDVYQIWAIPSHDPHTPPPHSTGSAVDITLVDATGQEVFMGSPIDELSARSQPDYFREIAADPNRLPSERESAQLADQHRQLLNTVMLQAGFLRHPGEWWHFCYGDQMWAWLTHQRSPDSPVVARYGRVEPVLTIISV